MLQLTKVLSGLKLGAQGHLIVSSPNNLQEIRPEGQDKKKKKSDRLQQLRYTEWKCAYGQKSPEQNTKFWMCESAVTNQRTEAGPSQRHSEGRHGNWTEVKDSGIYVQWRESLNKNRKSLVSLNQQSSICRSRGTTRRRHVLLFQRDTTVSTEQRGRRFGCEPTYPRGDDDRLKSLKNRFDGYGWVHTAERNTDREQTPEQSLLQRLNHQGFLLPSFTHCCWVSEWEDRVLAAEISQDVHFILKHLGCCILPEV